MDEHILYYWLSLCRITPLRVAKLLEIYTPFELFERVKKAYGDDFRGGLTFGRAIHFKQNLVSVTPLNATGHTPGHTVFLIESEGQKLMVVGDLLHAAALQFPVPEACARFDMDPPEAVKARRRILDMAAEENIPIAGMHFPAPGIGFVKKNAAGGYDFLPIKDY